MTIAENIRRIRRSAGMTQEEFGKLAGVSSMAVSQWENGRAVPRMGAVEKIAASLRIAKSDIIEGEGLGADSRLYSNRIPVKGMPMGRVPLVGNTHAGKACLPEELDEFPEVEVPQFLIDRDPGSYGLEVDGDCMDRVCPPGMVAVVQPGVAARSGDVVVATIDGADSVMRRMTVINGDLILSPESHNPDHENMYIAAQDDRQVHVEHVAYFQSREAF
ncbi:LexA family transcriptional regulator [uncultured Ellagibacter sp.]|uniref:LexA family protein n=1 Tax=uncultured Ellagibacter sp. TaxID=2137580 RepID=UPI002607FE4E|nr:XRE family transcriptional regulator [uncultured Ellagibacter sp.]